MVESLDAGMQMDYHEYKEPWSIIIENSDRSILMNNIVY